MKMPKKIKTFILKTTVVLVSAIAVNILAYGILRTYSWFVSDKTAVVKADVNTENEMFNVDIRYKVKENNTYVVKSVRVIGNGVNYNPNEYITNPVEIAASQISNSNNSANPVLYFQLDGDLVYYMLHINPIKLDSEKESKSFININTRLRQANALSNQGKTTGILKIRYLNGFLEKDIKIQFDNLELSGRAYDPINKQWYEINK